ncbi:MAG: hypothetical protein ABR613_09850 [Actinomycetota bacterium]
MAVVVEIVSADPAVRAQAARAFTRSPVDWAVRLVDEPSGHADVVVGERALTATGASVVFDPARPDDAVRATDRLLRRARAGSRTIVVVGAAGGAGATTVALHLAAAWGRGTCVADVSGGVRRRLGLPDDARTWLPRDDDVSGAALPVAGGFRVLCAPAPCPPPDGFPVAAAQRDFERVVIDAGKPRDLDRLLESPRVGVLVTPPTRPGAGAARELLETSPGVRWAVVANRVGPGGQIMRHALEALLGRALALDLPCCPALRDAEDEARLLRGRWHRWARRVARLAAALDAC